MKTSLEIRAMVDLKMSLMEHTTKIMKRDLTVQIDALNWVLK